MNKKFLALATAIGLIGPIAAPVTYIKAASNNTTQSDQAEMRQFVRNTMNQNHVRGSAVIIKNGVPQQISFGYAWYGKRIGNGNSKVVYPVCSLQKVITAAMIVQLINENLKTSQRFTQNTKISRWYPNMTNANKITVGNLLTHTSGIIATGTEIYRGKTYSEASAIQWAVNNVNSSPEGTVGTYYYNNINYILLAGIIRAVTGKSYQANFNQRIVKKLGLTNTYLYQDIPSNKTDSISYYSNGGKNYTKAAYVKKQLASQMPGTGDMFSTPMDYYKIQVGLTNGQILSSSDFHYLTHLTSKNATSNYSGGIYLKNNDNLKMAYGNIAGNHFGNWFQMTTDNQNGLIMFLNQTNDNEASVKAVGYQILNHIKANTFTSK